MIEGQETNKRIYGRVYVETPCDTDQDGRPDRIACYIYLPDTGGKRIPAVFVADPYFRTCNEDWYVLHDVDPEDGENPGKRARAPWLSNVEKSREEEPGERGRSASQEISGNESSRSDVRTEKPAPSGGSPEIGEMPLFRDEELIREELLPVHDLLIENGYGVVYAGGLGTRDSDGFTVSGSREETAAFRAVIDWLNGRARAYTGRENDREVKASWCTGDTAMMGKSYLGSLQFAVAGTGVPGLKTIIPEAGVSDWYRYYRENGLAVPALGWQGDDIDLLSGYCMSRSMNDDFDGIREAYFEKLREIHRLSDRPSGNRNAFWDERNYLPALGNYKGSAWIIQGLSDWNVKPDQSILAYQALAANGNEVRLLLHRGEHVYIYDREEIPIKEELLAWLDRFLKGKETEEKGWPQVLIEDANDPQSWIPSQTFPPEGTEEIIFDPGISCDVLLQDDLHLTKYQREEDNREEWLRELALGAYRSVGDHAGISENGFAVRMVFPVSGFSGSFRLCGSPCIEFDGVFDGELPAVSAILFDLSDDGFRFVTQGHMDPRNRGSLYQKERMIPGEPVHVCLPMIPTDWEFPKGHTAACCIFGTDPGQTVRQNRSLHPMTIRLAGDSLRFRAFRLWKKPDRFANESILLTKKFHFI